ncbi:MAG: FAD-dependent oxidoreductase [Pirellulaceae bacterium]
MSWPTKSPDWTIALGYIFWQRLVTTVLILFWIFDANAALGLQNVEADVVVYGGTSAGVVAAVQCARMGKTVVLIEPGKHLGGLTSGALGATDIGNKAAIGGLSREFYRQVKQHYLEEKAWVFEPAERFTRGDLNTESDAMWVFEPHVAESIMDRWVEHEKITVVCETRLNRTDGVRKSNGVIQSIEAEDGRVFAAKQFIDATYEGDLMAAADVTFTIGREANSVHGETLNGVQTARAIHHQLQPGVDPYRIPGDPSSGLLPDINAQPPAADGSGDRLVQTYNIRICATYEPKNRMAFEKPDGYDPIQYELLLRNFEAGEKRAPWNPLMMPNLKTDANNNFGVSTDFIGHSHQWAEADYATRDRIYQEHLNWTRGLMWTLANNERVPKQLRQEFSRWGTCRDEFTDNGGWSHQLYVREARRMVSDYVMTQSNCQGKVVAYHPVGLAAYTMDSHNVQRYVDANGHVRNEGDVQVGGFPPYPIAWESILPRRSECTNLTVPVCLSASHIAYGSIRMEPVFMVLAQSAATAACLAIDDNATLHDLDYNKLKSRLLEDRQVLEWNRK